MRSWLSKNRHVYWLLGLIALALAYFATQHVGLRYHVVHLLCTGGMSVDPDDNTPGGIRQSGARIVTYGAPVLPGAMFLLGYYDDGTPVMGLPGCVMYAGATIFDLVLPWVAADVSVTKEWIVSLGEGGLCLGCQPCRWPICPFGK